MNLFDQYTIAEESPDAIILDTKGKKHKAVRFNKPQGIEDETSKGKDLPKIEIYIHNEQKDGNGDPLMVLVGKKEAINKTLQTAKQLKLVINISKLTPQTSDTTPSKKSPNKDFLPEVPKAQKFTIKDIKIGESYE